MVCDSGGVVSWKCLVVELPNTGVLPCKASDDGGWKVVERIGTRCSSRG